MTSKPPRSRGGKDHGVADPQPDAPTSSTGVGTWSSENDHEKKSAAIAVADPSHYGSAAHDASRGGEGDVHAVAMPHDHSAELAAIRAQLDGLLVVVRQQAAVIEQQSAMIAALTGGTRASAEPTVTWGQIWDAYDAIMVRKRAWWMHVQVQLRPTIALLRDRRVAETKRADWIALRTGPLSHLAPGTRNLILKRLCSCIRWASGEGEMLPVGYPHPWLTTATEDGSPIRESEPGDDDLDELLRLARPKFAAFVRVAVRTALRRAENLSLRWEWIDWADGVARIPSGSTKGKKRSRVVPLPDDVLEALRELPRVPDSPYVFTNEATGKRYSLGWASNSWAKLAKRVRMQPSGDDPNVRLHDCRAKAFNDMVRTGIPITVAAKIGGWKTLDIVKRYLRINDDDARSARDVMNGPRRRGPRRSGDGVDDRGGTAHTRKSASDQ